MRNVPSFADKLDAALEVEGFGDADRRHRLWRRQFRHRRRRTRSASRSRPDEARDLAETRRADRRGRQRAARLRRIPRTPTGATSRSASSPGRSAEENGAWTGANAVAIRPGKVDRSPTGTGCSARMAVLHAKGRLQRRRPLSRPLDHRLDNSICHIEAETTLGAPPGDCPGHLRAGLDHRRPPAHAGPDRPLPRRLPAFRHLAYAARARFRPARPSPGLSPQAGEGTASHALQREPVDDLAARFSPTAASRARRSSARVSGPC